mgnify:CR=1 FL=1
MTQQKKKDFKIAMLGMIPGNGHPYSWSAIVNGYDPEAMASCPYPVIARYLGEQDLESVRIDGFQVSHIWTDDPAEAPEVARAAKIPNVVERPEDVIGEVDAVILATDDGTDHARRAAAFVEAGLPVFVDKPLATTVEDLRRFRRWRADGARLLSSSGLRYGREIEALRGQDWLWITGVTAKTWERYGIHVLEPVFTCFGPGFTEVRSERQAGSDIVYLRHRSGAQATLAAIEKAFGSYATFHAYGEEKQEAVRVLDTYAAFRGQLLAVTRWFREEIEPFPFAQTEEMMAVLIAALRSRDNGGTLESVDAVLEETL